MTPMTDAELTPAKIVDELDRYVVGQRDAKRAVAVAMRNRWRRQQVEGDLRDEIAPKNIIMIGPTGVGKTEISRRLAKLSQAPFIKVEASKFTEVGYVGRDVESIVRDLIEVAVNMVQTEQRESVRVRAEEHAEQRLLSLLAGSREAAPREPNGTFVVSTGGAVIPPKTGAAASDVRARLRAGELDDAMVELEVADSQNPLFSVLGAVLARGSGALDMRRVLRGISITVPFFAVNAALLTELQGIFLLKLNLAYAFVVVLVPEAGLAVL